MCALYFSLVIGQNFNPTVFRYLFLGFLFFFIARLYLKTFAEKHKEKGLNKKAIIAGIVLSVVVIGTGDHYVVPEIVRINKVVEITVTALGKKNEKSPAYEVWLTGINNNGSVDLNTLALDSGWKRKDNSLYVSEKFPSFLHLKLEKVSKNASLVFLKHEWSGMVQVTNGKQQNVIDLFDSSRSEYKYPIDVKQAKVINGSVVWEVIGYTLSFLVYAIIFYFLFTGIGGKPKAFFFCNCVLFGVVFIVPHFLSVTALEKMWLLLVTLVSSYLTVRAYDSGFSVLFNSSKSKLVIILIALYAGFAGVGNSLFFLNVKQPLTFQHLCVYLSCVLWFLPILISFLYITYQAARRLRQAIGSTMEVKLGDQFKLWVLFFSLCMLVCSIYLVAFFPACMTSDSIAQWNQATGIEKLNNWHPVFHTLMNKVLISIYESPSSIAFGQITYMSAVIASFLLFLYKRGISRKWLLFFLMVFMLIPVNPIYSITLWKDVPFTISLLWLTLVLSRIAYKKEYFNSITASIELVVALLAVALFRHNGMVVYMLVLLALLAYFFKCRKKGLIISLSASMVVFVMYNILVLGSGKIVPNSPAVKLVAPIHGIAAVMVNKVPLQSDIQAQMNAILSDTDWRAHFYPYSVSGYIYETHGVFMQKLNTLPTGTVLKWYASSFSKQPLLIARDRLQGVDYLWNISQPAVAWNSKYVTFLEPNDRGLKQENSNLKTWLTDYLKFSEVIGGTFIWRVGIYNIFALLLLYVIVKENKRFVLSCLPWLGCCFSLIPAMGDQEFRFVYFIYFLFAFIWFIGIINIKSNFVTRAKL